MIWNENQGGKNRISLQIMVIILAGSLSSDANAWSANSYFALFFYIDINHLSEDFYISISAHPMGATLNRLPSNRSTMAANRRLYIASLSVKVAFILQLDQQ